MTRKRSAEIVLSTADVEALVLMLGERDRRSRAVADALAGLAEKLQIADIVAAGPALEGRVTMNACIRYIEAGTGGGELTLTWPNAAMPDQGRISVLSPIGTALLGRSVGDEVTVELPYDTRRTLTITEVRPHQTESSSLMRNEEDVRAPIRCTGEPAQNRVVDVSAM